MRWNFYFIPQFLLIFTLSALLSYPNPRHNKLTINSSSQSFQYDDLNRLTYASGTKYGVINYTYDSIGNLITKNSTVYQYGLPDGSKPHAVTRFGDVTINYDANGNMLQKGNTNLTYDTENRLKKVEDTSSITLYTLNITLQYGWNFISIPVIPVNNSILSVLSSLRLGVDYDQVTRYNPDTKKFEHYIGNSNFDQFNTIEYGRGYQIYITNPAGATLTITGTIPQAQDFILKSGWNLIANPNLINKSVESSLDELSFNIDYLNK